MDAYLDRIAPEKLTVLCAGGFFLDDRRLTFIDEYGRFCTCWSPKRSCCPRRRPRPAAKLRVVRPARQGILVPVSNPQKVGVLIDLALSATGVDDSPPRVVAFVHRPAGGARSGIREVEQRVVPRSEALSAALEYALEREAANLHWRKYVRK
jgi:hypothetical protein